MTLEINTTRGLASSNTAQHRLVHISKNFHKGMLILPYSRRRSPYQNSVEQDTKNRQNSIDDVDPFTVQKFEMLMQQHFQASMDLYQKMLNEGIAKECARFVLPLACPTRLYMTGSVRFMDPLYRFAFC